jgi:HEPN domain-containing protein
MHSLRSESLFVLAEELLMAAENEMQRAAEDMVGHLVCVNARQSISNYLAGYLMENHIEILHPVSIDSLLKQCQNHDPAFNELEMEALQCRSDIQGSPYCLDPEKISVCLKTAQNVQSRVREIFS